MFNHFNPFRSQSGTYGQRKITGPPHSAGQYSCRKRCLITYHFTISRYQQTFVGRSVFDLLCTTGSRGFFFNFFNVSNSKLSSITALQVTHQRRVVMYISLCKNIVYLIILINLMLS